MLDDFTAFNGFLNAHPYRYSTGPPETTDDIKVTAQKMVSAGIAANMETAVAMLKAPGGMLSFWIAMCENG